MVELADSAPGQVPQTSIPTKPLPEDLLSAAPQHSSPPNRPTPTTRFDEIIVEELPDDGLGYASDIDIVYPDELEEMQSGSDTDDNCREEGNANSDTALARHMHRLHCQAQDVSSVLPQLQQRTNSPLACRKRARSEEESAGHERERATHGWSSHTPVKRLRHQGGETNDDNDDALLTTQAPVLVSEQDTASLQPSDIPSRTRTSILAPAPPQEDSMDIDACGDEPPPVA